MGQLGAPCKKEGNPKGGNHGKEKGRKETEKRKSQKKGQKGKDQEGQGRKKSQGQKITRLEPEKSEGWRSWSAFSTLPNRIYFHMFYKKPLAKAHRGNRSQRKDCPFCVG